MLTNLLGDHQLKALQKMHNGCILCGAVGSGKSRTALAYYYICNGGEISDNYIPLESPKDLYIITTAKKRDSLEWEGELVPFLLNADNVVIDSWNNIKKYKDIKDAFFIFDEQRVVGGGVWAKSFIKIARANEWILLSATPGDKWEDYIPVFIANGFYKNKTEFQNEHLVYDYRGSYPKLIRYLNTGRLIRLRNRILVDMPVERHTIQHHEDVLVDYDRYLYKELGKTRWNIWDDIPIENAAGLCYSWRRIVNSDESRQTMLLEQLEKHPRAIIFYNYDYELEILRDLVYGQDFEVAEWNGHKHQPVPESDSWVYLVQYNAGCEGWECIRTDTIIFFSQNYSYKVMVQAAGRIDRLNTPYRDLYYIHLKSKAPIDLAIDRALKAKKDFNEGRFVNRGG